MKDKKREEELKNEIRKCLDQHDLETVSFENHVITTYNEKGEAKNDYGPEVTIKIELRRSSN